MVKLEQTKVLKLHQTITLTNSIILRAKSYMKVPYTPSITGTITVKVAANSLINVFVADESEGQDYPGNPPFLPMAESRQVLKHHIISRVFSGQQWFLVLENWGALDTRVKYRVTEGTSG